MHIDHNDGVPQGLSRIARVTWSVGAIAWLGVIGWCTLQSHPDAAAEIANLSWYCVICGDGGVADVVLNILLFLPLGVALAALRWPLVRTVLVVMAISTAIEVFQGAALIGRDASLSDVLSNSAGGLFGWAGYSGLLALARPSRALARRGAAIVLAIMAGLWVATGAGLQPSLTESYPWIGQPMNAARGPQPFPGTMQRAAIDGISIPNEEMPQQAPWRDSIAIELNVTRNSAELFERGIVMLRIVDTAHTVQVAMDQKGDDAWLRLRLRAADWRLHNPRWQVSHAMRMAPDVPWRFRWTWLHDRFIIVNEPIDGPHATIIAVPLSIGLGWSFIHPFVDTIGTNRLLWTALWLAFWFGLLGWLAGALPKGAALVVGLIAIGCYLAASLGWGMPVQASEVVAAVGAYAVFALIAAVRRMLSS